MSLLGFISIVSDLFSISSAVVTTTEKLQRNEIFKDYGYWNNTEYLESTNKEKKYFEFVIEKKTINKKQIGYFTDDSNLNLLNLNKLYFLSNNIFPGIKMIRSLKDQGNFYKNEIFALSISFKQSLFLINLRPYKLHLNRIEKFRYQGKHRYFVF